MEAFDKPRRLTVRDLNNQLPNTAERLPWAQPTEPAHTGSTFRACSRCRLGQDKCICSAEVSWPWVMAALYALAILAGLFGPHLWARLS